MHQKMNYRSLLHVIFRCDKDSSKLQRTLSGIA